MKTRDFAYELPHELIAQTPLENRADSRLLLLDRHTGATRHEQFFHLPDYLRAGDVVVLNDTKVLPARLIGVKEETNAHIEILLLRQIKNDVWETLVKPSRRVKVGTRIIFGDGLIEATCVCEFEEGLKHLDFRYQGIFYEVLDRLGEMPLPPYIHEKLLDRSRYQTVYSKELGSAAAPTAGLHFTPELLRQISEKNIEIVYLTLHVGLGTFRPVQTDDIQSHQMHQEYYHLSYDSASILKRAKNEGRRIIAVGTTSTRTLESIMQLYGTFVEASGFTDIFIYPGYAFQAIDCLITNFHLPMSTLIMMVSAFSSREHILAAYQEAIRQRYRFFSFGDAMMIGKNLW